MPPGAAQSLGFDLLSPTLLSLCFKALNGGISSWCFLVTLAAQTQGFATEESTEVSNHVIPEFCSSVLHSSPEKAVEDPSKYQDDPPARHITTEQCPVSCSPLG